MHKNQAVPTWNLGNNLSICFKTELKICFKLQTNRAVNTPLVGHKDQSVNAVRGNTSCFFLDEKKNQRNTPFGKT